MFGFWLLGRALPHQRKTGEPLRRPPAREPVVCNPIPLLKSC
nr:MAG TPA: hypothetical protein [Caudoviricetes sp.]